MSLLEADEFRSARLFFKSEESLPKVDQCDRAALSSPLRCWFVSLHPDGLNHQGIKANCQSSAVSYADKEMNEVK